MKIKNSVSRRQLLESTTSALLLLPLLRVFRETEAYLCLFPCGFL
jgi:hypothetical protein